MSREKTNRRERIGEGSGTVGMGSWGTRRIDLAPPKPAAARHDRHDGTHVIAPPIPQRPHFLHAAKIPGTVALHWCASRSPVSANVRDQHQARAFPCLNGPPAPTPAEHHPIAEQLLRGTVTSCSRNAPPPPNQRQPEPKRSARSWLPASANTCCACLEVETKLSATCAPAAARGWPRRPCSSSLG